MFLWASAEKIARNYRLGINVVNKNALHYLLITQSCSNAWKEAFSLVGSVGKILKIRFAIFVESALQSNKE